MRILFFSDGYFNDWMPGVVRSLGKMRPGIHSAFYCETIEGEALLREKYPEIPTYCVRRYLMEHWEECDINKEDIHAMECTMGATFSQSHLSEFMYHSVYKSRFPTANRQETYALFLRRNILMYKFSLMILEEFQPDITFYEQVGGSVNYILAVLSRKYGCQSFWIFGGYVPNHFLLVDGLTCRSPILERNVARTESPPENFLKQAREFLKEFTHEGDVSKAEEHVAVAARTKVQRRWRNPFNLARLGFLALRGHREYLRKTAKDCVIHYQQDPLTQYLNGIRSYFNTRYLLQECSRYTIRPTEDRYILFLLSMQPEASSYGLAPHFWEQKYVAMQLATAIPSEFCIYLKEHKAQFVSSYARGKGFFEDLSYFGNIRMVNPFENTRELIKKSCAVVTLSGSAGLEAIILGKPVILFGRQFYARHSSVFQVSSVTDLPGILEKALYQFTPPTHDEIVDYFARLMMSISPGILCHENLAASKENIENIARSLLHDIEDIMQGAPENSHLSSQKHVSTVELAVDPPNKPFSASRGAGAP